MNLHVPVLVGDELACTPFLVGDDNLFSLISFYLLAKKT
jgi:hypothetical protein